MRFARCLGRRLGEALEVWSAPWRFVVLGLLRGESLLACLPVGGWLECGAIASPRGYGTVPGLAGRSRWI